MKLKLPDTLVLLAAVLTVFAALTWVVPAGSFDREVKTINGSDRTLVVPGTYTAQERNPSDFSDLILATIKGFQESSDIIVFIFMVAGGFGIILKTGAIEAGLQSVVRWSGQKSGRKRWVIPILVTLFSLAGATFGMSEEGMVFVLVTLPLAFALGYDSLVGVSIPFVGAGVGFAGAFLNPFTVGIAHGIAGLTPFSGWEYRILVWVVFTGAAIV
ncbi:MAG TPA: YfcC family protein, partial [Cytophagales bacterium]|nr:YfcC family protein [Cytophagales bacterium]